MTSDHSWWRLCASATLRLVTGQSYDDLLCSEEDYVCDIRGDGRQLAVLTVVADDSATVRHYCVDEWSFAVPMTRVQAEDGRLIHLLRGQILWPASDHAEIVVATTALSLDLVPARRSPTPQWRLGGAWIDAAVMASLGRDLGAARDAPTA